AGGDDEGGGEEGHGGREEEAEAGGGEVAFDAGGDPGGDAEAEGEVDGLGEFRLAPGGDGLGGGGVVEGGLDGGRGGGGARGGGDGLGEGVEDRAPAEGRGLGDADDGEGDGLPEETDGVEGVAGARADVGVRAGGLLGGVGPVGQDRGAAEVGDVAAGGGGAGDAALVRFLEGGREAFGE